MSKTSPVYFGAGSCKVSVYSPTQALPYYRLCYRVGGRRYQRTRKTFEKAELGLRLDQAIYEYTEARRRLGEVALSEAVNCYLNHHPLGISLYVIQFP
jgi:hypothetical protein